MPHFLLYFLLFFPARGSFLLYQLAKAINSGHPLELEQEQELEHELIVEQEVDVVDSSWLAAMANEFQVATT